MLKILVIGAGIAGLTFSLKASEFAEVTLISKEEISNSNSMLAQGGISAVWDSKDSIQKHINDTLIAGDGLCDEKIVHLVVNQASNAINTLIDYGVNFTKKENGELDLAKEGGHSHNRVIHVKDHTGRSIVQILEEKVKSNKNINIKENIYAIDLLINQNTCFGAEVLDLSNNEISLIEADYTILACGGLAQAYKYNTNPEIATGDGIAMAYRAGAKIKDMEFVQFHPTMLYNEDNSAFLISEAVRGFGAELVNADGIPFMKKYHPLASLAPRDIVSRAIYYEMQINKSKSVYLDLRKINQNEFKSQFPSIYTKLILIGLDPQNDLIPVVPSAHFICGGILTNNQGQTSIDNLYAIGENACTGLHGANRLASNSLLEGLVFANQASNSIQKSKNQIKQKFNSKTNFSFADCKINISKESIQNIMWENVGIIREDHKINFAFTQLKQFKEELISQNPFQINKNYLQILNLLECSILIAQSALNRNENKGAHFKL